VQTHLCRGTVTNHLIYQYTDQAIEQRRLKEQESSDSYWEPSAREWRALHKSAAAKVEGLTPEECVEQSKAIDLETERRQKVERLAYHQSSRRAAQLGLARSSDQRAELLKEEEQRHATLDDAALDLAIAELDAWQDGKLWSDNDYVRDHLIYMYTDRAIEDRAVELPEDSEDDWTPTPTEWKELYDEAVVVVDAIPVEERVDHMHAMQAAEEKKYEEQWAAQSREEFKEAAGETVGFFFSSMFSPMDLLFLLLAIGSAFKLASGGTEGGD